LTMQIYKVSIAKELSPDLALRDVASSFMNKMANFDCDEVEIDFEGVESITRSFAHGYLARKRAMTIILSEVNVPANVRKMFAIIQNSEMRPRFDALRNAPIIKI
jgi:hypothetical protein